jgi:hypothetical protein
MYVTVYLLQYAEEYRQQFQGKSAQQQELGLLSALMAIKPQVGVAVSTFVKTAFLDMSCLLLLTVQGGQVFLTVPVWPTCNVCIALGNECNVCQPPRFANLKGAGRHIFAFSCCASLDFDCSSLRWV